MMAWQTRLCRSQPPSSRARKPREAPACTRERERTDLAQTHGRMWGGRNARDRWKHQAMVRVAIVVKGGTK